MTNGSTEMTKKADYFISGNATNASMSANITKTKFQPAGSRNCGFSLPPHIVEHLDSFRGRYPRSKLVLNLIKKGLELKEVESG